MRQTRNLFLRSGAAPVFAGFILLAFTLGATFWFVAIERDNRIANRRAVEFETELQRVLALLQDAETGQRGYLLTGDEAYLGPYRLAVASLDPQFEAAGRAMPAQSDHRQALASLRATAADKLAELDLTVDLQRSGRRDDALAIVRSGAGKTVMDRAREIIAGMVSVEERKVASYQTTVATAGTWLQAGVFSTVLLFGMLAAYALANTYRQMRDLVVSRDKLSAANAELAREMAERERLESQLRQSQKMEAIGQITGGLAHDFNNMLAVIIGSLNLLKRRMARGEPDFGRFIDSALDGAERAATLTHRLLAFSRQQPLAPHAVDVNKFVGGMSDLLHRTLGEHVRLETVLAGGLWRTFLDASQLESAILNLAVNARDAMPEGGRLTIETANCHLDESYAAENLGVPPGQYVMIAVTDTGRGMPPEVIGKAFDPFFTTKPPGQGTGLGLSQVHGFVKQSGGHVKIYSELGHGTTIKIYMPRFTGTDTPVATKVIVQTLPPGHAREVILVVEDEERARQIAAESLRELGYTVLHAADGTSALRLIDERPDITLMFTDIVMPGMTGRQLADAARRRRADLKVLYTTGYTRNAIIHNGVVDPDVQLITKPFSLEHLARKVREVLDA